MRQGNKCPTPEEDNEDGGLSVVPEQTTDDDSNTNERYELELTSRHSKAVSRLKATVLLVLSVAACVVSGIIYAITHRGEISEFNAEYEGMVGQIVERFERVLLDRVYALSSLSVTFTTFADATNATWPFVTMNEFQERAKVAKGLSGAMHIQMVTFVDDIDREQWETYTQTQDWLPKTVEYQKDTGISNLFPESWKQDFGPNITEDPYNLIFGYTSYATKIWTWGENFENIVAPEASGPYPVLWQTAPLLPRHGTNIDLRAYPTYGKLVDIAFKTGDIVLGGITSADPGDMESPNPLSAYYATLLTIARNKPTFYPGDPFCQAFIPVFDSFSAERKVVAVIYGVMNWAAFFQNTLQRSGQAVDVVLENYCDGNYTYSVSKDEVKFIGNGNLHDTELSEMVRSAVFDAEAFAANSKLNFNEGNCPYTLHVYPTKRLMRQYVTPLPEVLAALVAGILAFTIAVFFLYDRLVERRQKRVLDAAVRTNAIVSSIFPQQVRDRLEEEALLGTTTKLRGFLESSGQGVDQSAKGVLRYKTKPIADFFASATIFFADVEGFTAWSSTREPFQVFSLLESLYGAFDQLADQHRIYKVETVGDCYVAVSGLPDPRKDHAVAITRFALACVKRCESLTKRLEVLLGPDTGDLRIRVGLHSGEVTAGVLRGSRSRFQLFGDSVNTASRIESTGMGNRIHLSAETANLLISAGKGHWIEPRADKVTAKGKGEMSTFWLKASVASGPDSIQEMSGDSCELGTEPTGDAFQAMFQTETAKTNRLVKFNVEILSTFLKQIIARREACGKNAEMASAALIYKKQNTAPIKEVSEIVVLPEFNKSAAISQESLDSVKMSEALCEELFVYIQNISQLYNCNPFHNFEHASHVTMSVVKLLSRIVAPSDMDFEDRDGAMTTLHDHSFGITSDPLTQFSCVLAALIHDAGHYGVPNAQLMKENDELAVKYSNQSMAEQYSLDLCWNLLMQEEFSNLRSAIYANESEMHRFRQLLVNEVLSTDICDKELKALRNARWDKAFKELDEDRNRRATIVIEHLIQASDVAHTMQHWHVYRKWNERLYMEMFKAYKEGRSEADPSISWYEGEIGFFDFYIIPLAKKLKDCGIFGVSSDEYLSYANRNRQEWESKGRAIVEQMAEKANQLWSS